MKSGKPDFESNFYMNLLPIEEGTLISLSELRIKWDYGCIWEVPGTQYVIKAKTVNYFMRFTLMMA